ncbi:hypothetical protein [Streptosporangium sp. 'caverna']|uniref:hypothetical protein n=1 Tax=Streptosporangium sp. 'caverna' TaxID=2202249 RepID=UPI000D7DB84B|nr:hypothetical protein [Streptosporangium sp. 'caverna']AWS40906.1 hypothetical protein DKM19_05595 [Streptosporangium sp. 'caverna']
MTIARACRAPVVLALMLASLAAGCGITPTGVRDGGAPAVGFRPSTRLYFVSGARLQAVIRPIPWPPLKETLNLLMDGPSAAERGRGLRSELRPGAETPIKVTSGQAKVRISLPRPEPAEISGPAPVPAPGPARPVPMQASPVPRSTLWMGQLTCTAASALAARTNIDPDAVTVTIQQAGVARTESFRCSEFPRGSE